MHALGVLALVSTLAAAPTAGPTAPTEIVRPAKRMLVVHAAPASAKRVRVGPRTEYGSRIRYAVVERRGGWLGVITPAVANGRIGWVQTGSVRRARYLRERVEIDLSRRLLRLLQDEREVLRATVGVGAPDSPTPIGRFAITDRRPGSEFGAVYGCCVLVLSGYQPRPPRGWAPVAYRLALHGGRPGTIGAAKSAGCVHVPARVLRLLMQRLPAGTPVTIDP